MERAEVTFALHPYAAEHPELPAVLRIDLLAIDLAADGEPSIEHIEGAVEG